MIGTLNTFALDCPDPQALAKFYQGALGGEIVADGDDDWVDLMLPGGGPHISFQESLGYQAPRWPSDDGDQQAHLDITVVDFDEAHDQLLAIGARFLKKHPGFRVYLDPVGHPFCTVGADHS